MRKQPPLETQLFDQTAALVIDDGELQLIRAVMPGRRKYERFQQPAFPAARHSGDQAVGPLPFFMQIQNDRLPMFVQSQRNPQLRQACRFLPGRAGKHRLGKQALKINLTVRLPASLFRAVKGQSAFAKILRIAEINFKFLDQLSRARQNPAMSLFDHQNPLRRQAQIRYPGSPLPDAGFRFGCSKANSRDRITHQRPDRNHDFLNLPPPAVPIVLICPDPPQALVIIELRQPAERFENVLGNGTEPGQSRALSLVMDRKRHQNRIEKRKQRFLIADQTDLVKFKEIPGQRRGGAERMRRLPDLDLPLDLLIRGIAQIQRLQIHFGNQRQPLTA